MSWSIFIKIGVTFKFKTFKREMTFMKSNVLNFPKTKGDKWRKQIAGELRRLADIVEKDRADPQIHGFVICLMQGDKYVFGGCGQISEKERSAMTKEYFKFLDKLRKSELETNS